MKQYYALFESNTSKQVGALFMGDDFLKNNKDKTGRESVRQSLLGVWRELLRAYYALSNKLCSFPKEVKSSPAGVTFEFAGRKLRVHRAYAFCVGVFALSEEVDEGKWVHLLRVIKSPKSLYQVYVRSETEAVFIIKNWSCLLTAIDQVKKGEQANGLLSLVQPENDTDWIVDIGYAYDGSPDKDDNDKNNNEEETEDDNG